MYLDQFRGTTLARSGPGTYGRLGAVTELGVLTHMGTQFGVWNRILITVGCALLLLSLGSSSVMWWLRRPARSAGLPRRPMDPRLPWVLAGSALVVGLVYPLWGVSAIVVLLGDRLLIRRLPLLRSAFGLPERRGQAAGAAPVRQPERV